MQNEPLWIVPVAIGLIAAESLSDRLTHNRGYEVKDTLTSLAISLMSIVTTLLCRGVSFLYLSKIYDHSLIKVPTQWWTWLMALMISDFLGYWFHWLGHHSTFFWLAHAPHHSSAKFNLSTAIRTPVFNACFRFIFWTPLCLIGFHPGLVISIESLIFIYQFFIHTEYVGKLGWLEYVFNTPSHHRVHHGTNDQYVDRNFGCVFIVWDRLFRTYQDETVPVNYGIVNRKPSFNPLRIVLADYRHLFARLCGVRYLSEGLQLAFGPPGLTKLDVPVAAISANPPADLKCTFSSAEVNSAANSSKGFILITGASSGIGRALAFEFAKRGYNLVLLALPDSGLLEVSEQLRAYPVTTYIYEANLLQPEECAKLLTWCKDRKLRMTGIVNNVGIGSLEPFEHSGITSIFEMIDLNIRVLVLLTRMFIVELRKEPRSYIMNVGSMASEMSIPDKAVYLATKAFVKQFSACLHAELAPCGVHVCCLCSGSTFTGARVRAIIEQCGIGPGLFCKQPEFVARHAVSGMFRLRRVIVPGYINRFILIVCRLMPFSLTQALFFFIFRKKRRAFSGLASAA